MSAIEWLMKRSSSTDLLPDGTHIHPTTVPDLQKQVYLWIGVVDIFLFTISTLLFVYRGRRTLDINAHAVLLTSIGSFTILVVNTCFLFQFVWPGNFPCFIILWCAYPGVMLWMSCTLARAMRLYILSYRNTQKLKERNKVGQMTAAQLYGKGAVQDPEAALGDTEKLQASSLESSVPKSFVRRRLDALSKWWAAEKAQITERRLVWYVLFATLFASIVCSIIQALTKDLAIVPMMYSKCPVGVWEYFPLYAMIALYCVVLTPILVYHIWPIKDAFGIRHDILLNNMFTFICVLMFMVQTNKGFGGRDPFWDSFLWCALLFNLSQITSVIIPLVRSYRQSDAFTWSDSPGRTASKELFYRVLNHPELFEKLKIYSAANFCTEITLFLEEYQVLKANVVRFYNIGEPGFDDDGANDSEGDDDDEDDLAHGGDMSASRPNLASGAGWTTVVTRANNDGGHGQSSTSRSMGSPLSQHSDVNIITGPICSEKDALRVHLNGQHRSTNDLESNPDTIISVGDARSSDEDYSDKAAMVPSRNSRAMPRPDTAGQGIVGRLTSETSRGIAIMGNGSGGAGGSGSRLGGLLRSFGGRNAGNNVNNGFSDISNDSNGGDNSATLAGGGAIIGKLPVRRNSRGEDIMVLSHVPPFTPVRYTILSTLMQTPSGMGRQGNITTFKTLPFALRGDYYGFYSTFIADGATLQINVEGRISEVITRLIHSQQYTVDMMDEAHSEVLQLLYDNIFKKFVRIYHRDMADIIGA
ncbi:hypothetical protein FBU59_000074 [Linderina macrospora]|uniref:Uncharacterized protein n=1 Tax=Linderina macrospora TaxID=4868 RepID=A0ACC1JHL9_9FUNG|nr:hypothetical protein FBU59_000074 [Linderina macrospora]